MPEKGLGSAHCCASTVNAAHELRSALSTFAFGFYVTENPASQTLLLLLQDGL